MTRQEFEILAKNLTTEQLIELAHDGLCLAIGVQERIDLDGLTEFPKGGNSHIAAKCIVDRVNNFVVEYVRGDGTISFLPLPTDGKMLKITEFVVENLGKEKFVHDNGWLCSKFGLSNIKATIDHVTNPTTLPSWAQRIYFPDRK